MTPQDFYFCQILTQPESEYDSVILFISKSIWDAGEGLDCIPEPNYLRIMLEKLGGSELMENVFEFGDITSERAKQSVFMAGFVENLDLKKDPLADFG